MVFVFTENFRPPDERFSLRVGSGSGLRTCAMRRKVDARLGRTVTFSQDEFMHTLRAWRTSLQVGSRSGLLTGAVGKRVDACLHTSP